MASATPVVLRVVAALAAVGVAVLVAGAWWVGSLYQSEQADSARASAAFAEVRARFPGLEPAFQIRDTRLVVLREPTAAPSPPLPAAAHILVWQPRERMLSRVTLPLWTSTVATEPVPLDA